MSYIKAREHLEKFGLGERAVEFPVSSATVELAAKAVGCPPAQIAKTLSFLVDGAAVLIVAAGDVRVDNKKFKAAFGTKAKMLGPDEVEPMTGYAVGGVCPFGVNGGVRVFLDESLRRFDAVYPACGSANSAVRLSCAELFTASGAEKWIDVTKQSPAL